MKGELLLLSTSLCSGISSAGHGKYTDGTLRNVSGCLRHKVEMNSVAAGWLRRSETIIQAGIALSPGCHTGSAICFTNDSTAEDETG